MSESRESSSRAGVMIAVVIMLVIVMPLLYVLSVGPASWLASHGYVDMESTRDCYWPLIALHDTCPPIRPILQGYIALFES